MKKNDSLFEKIYEEVKKNVDISSDEKYIDKQKIEEKDIEDYYFSTLTPFQKLLVNELRSISNSLIDINNSYTENKAIENEDGINGLISKVYGAIDDLSSDISENFDELKEVIKNK